MTQLKDAVRITPRKVSKEEILKYIAHNPGKSGVEIAMALGQRRNEMASRLTMFSKGQRIQRRKQDGRIRYYDNAYLLLPDPSEVKQTFRCLECGREFKSAPALNMHKIRVHSPEGMSHATRGSRASSLTWLSAHPGATRHEFAEGLGIAPSSAHKRLGTLLKHKMVTRDNKGEYGSSRYFVTEAAAAPANALPGAVPPPITSEPQTGFIDQLMAEAKAYIYHHPENGVAVRDFVAVQLLKERDNGN
jgi:hypothetical protein